MSIVERVREAGVVGAGGAGFPTHVKLGARAEAVIANGAECEPLLCVDKELMQHRAQRVVRGLRLAMEATGARRGVIATKARYSEAVAALRAELGDEERISLHLLAGYYPSGDEKSLIYEVAGQVVPSGKLPPDVGCAVLNVGTLIGVADAAEGVPVTAKTLTIGGDVPSPVTVEAPVGAGIRALLPLAGFAGDEGTHALIVGGPCMGVLAESWDEPITKTTGGLLLLRRDHPLIVRRLLSVERQAKLARAVCCQCSFCTQMCPRSALGLRVEPHKAMRAFVTGRGALLGDPRSVLACSSCGLCTNYACNFGLAPDRVMDALKAAFGKAGIGPVPEADIRADPFVAFKRVPVKRLIARMGLAAFDRPAPFAQARIAPDRVRLLLRQAVGKPSLPVVQKGARVRRGEVIAAIPENALGAALHASIDGTVTAVSDTMIEISKGGVA
ncbi:MAG: 4Fe-4S dicluster domain-containing protein [Clostridia bacterium]|nr:4Fe-4S dicluster domain-containing protein [Clostridia bacterium]